MMRKSLMILTLLICSCAAPLESYSQAQHMANRDLTCSQVSPVVTRRRKNLVHAFQGCGRYAIYDCTWSSGQGSQCQLVASGEGRAWDNESF